VVWPGDDGAHTADPVDALVRGPHRRARHVLVEGEPVVRDGHLRGVHGDDLTAWRRDLAKRARRLWP
jgi:hypothetical protein